MPAELIQKTDTNRQTFPKINQAIIDSFEAITKAARADQNSNLAISRMKSVQSQLNQIVIEGDSSVEAAQARVNDEGFAFNTLQERLNTEKSQVKAEIQSAKDQLMNDYKNFYLDKASEVYLYDLQLAKETVNQALTVDEEKREIYATQAYNFTNDNTESFVISRLTLGGKLLDSMVVRFGGHGTTIGLERTNDKIYIWSNIIRTNIAGSQVSQFLCRYPYQANSEITIDSPNVVKYDEFLNASLYMNPFSDTKNGLLGQRHTDSRTSRHSWIEIYDMEKYKIGNKDILYSFDFTNEMDSLSLQGTSLDGTDLYISFGITPEEHRVYHVDLETGNIIGVISRPVGRNSANEFDEGHGELEGLHLYTNPETGYKTLLTVVVTDAAGRRRQKLYGLSWNAGIQEFMGYSVDRSQSIKLTRDDGKGKRIPYVTDLKTVIEPGEYYMTSAETQNMVDHPNKGVGGWFMTVSGGDTGGSVKQTLTRNSITIAQEVYRIVNVAGGTASPWWITTVQEFKP